jgi:ABC-type antimicrobial peptide transport system permease subunit
VRSIPGVLAVVEVPAAPAAPAIARLEVRVAPARLEAAAKAIEDGVEGVEASPLLKTSASDAQLTHRLTLLLLAVSGVSFLLALLSVGAATGALVGERRVEVGLMLALGYSGRRVGGLLAAELLAAALVAALAGALLGEIAASVLERRVLGGAGALGRLSTGAGMAAGSGAVLSWPGLAAAAAVAVLVVGASLAVALRRIERLDAAMVLRGE